MNVPKITNMSNTYYNLEIFEMIPLYDYFLKN